MAEMGAQRVFTPSQKAAPLCALNYNLRKRFAMYLNVESMITIDDGVPGDCFGLAELIGFDYIEIKHFARERNPNPTLEILDEWTKRSDLTPTVGKLVEYLQEMSREDVLTDLYDRIVENIEAYEKRKKSLQASPVQDETVSQSTFPIAYQRFNDHSVDETQIMTTDDVERGSPQYYDAFICYNPEGTDLMFVKTMINMLENPPYNLKLFVPGRNDLPGSAAYTISANLIEHRCRRMVIILSPRYLESPACDFQTKFAFCLSPGSRSKKLVPVLIEQCQIPSILRFITMCDYTRRDLQEWIWGRIVNAIRAPLNGVIYEKSTSLSEITLDISSSFEQVNPSSSSSGYTSSRPSIAQSSSSSTSSSSSSSFRNVISKKVSGASHSSC